MPPFDPGPRAEFINTSDGQVGAIRYKPNGDESAIAVGPGDRVTLSESEQELTAKAHRDPTKSPFLPQPYEKRDPLTDDILDQGERPLLELTNESDRPWIPGVPDNRPRVPSDPKKRTARQKQLLEAGEAVIDATEEDDDEDGDDGETEPGTDGSRDDLEETGNDTPGSRRRRRKEPAEA